MISDEKLDSLMHEFVASRVPTPEQNAKSNLELRAAAKRMREANAPTPDEDYVAYTQETLSDADADLLKRALGPGTRRPTPATTRK